MNKSNSKSEAKRVNHQKLGQLGRLVEKQINISQRLVEAEETVKSIKKEYNIVAQDDIPTLMDEIGLSKVETVGGLTVTVKEIMTAGVTQKKKAECIKWLLKNKLGALVTDNVNVQFVAGEQKLTNQLIKELKSNGYDPTRSYAVNTGSIKAIMWERLEEGLEVPFELFGILIIRQSIIT